MKFSKEQQEQAAEHIFDAMAEAANTGEKPQPWQPDGNSTMQQTARFCAAHILTALPGAPDAYLGGDPKRTIPAAIDHSTFEDRLRRIINYHSMECMGRGGDTPDVILAQLLVGTLNLFDRTIRERERYYGRLAGSKVQAPTPMEQGVNALLAEDQPIPGSTGDGRTFAPFGVAEVAQLENWQAAEHVHQLDHCDVPMSVHKDGLHCSQCNFIQRWVPTACLQGPPQTV